MSDVVPVAEDSPELACDVASAVPAGGRFFGRGRAERVSVRSLPLGPLHTIHRATRRQKPGQRLGFFRHDFAEPSDEPTVVPARRGFTWDCFDRCRPQTLRRRGGVCLSVSTPTPLEPIALARPIGERPHPMGWAVKRSEESIYKTRDRRGTDIGTNERIPIDRSRIAYPRRSETILGGWGHAANCGFRRDRMRVTSANEISSDGTCSQGMVSV